MVALGHEVKDTSVLFRKDTRLKVADPLAPTDFIAAVSDPANSSFTFWELFMINVLCVVCVCVCKIAELKTWTVRYGTYLII